MAEAGPLALHVEIKTARVEQPRHKNITTVVQIALEITELYFTGSHRPWVMGFKRFLSSHIKTPCLT